MNKDALAKEALILALMDNWPSMTGRFTTDHAKAYTEAVSEASLESVKCACRDYAMDKVDGHDPRYPPTGPQLAARAGLWDRARGIAKPAPRLYTGILSVDFGHGRIDMRGRTEAEQDEIFKAKGLPRKIIAGEVRPRLRHMSGAYTAGDDDTGES